uniref:G_PROTEIN_RECEP_F1_2 domain-containing protein n=1 Tax=Ascaris lumbricoides TaxID=6252 RepID=A0A0M3HPP7_ASCLU
MHRARVMADGLYLLLALCIWINNRWVYCRLLPRLIVYLAPNIERSVREERICYKRAAVIFV